VRSLPDAVARALEMHMDTVDAEEATTSIHLANGKKQGSSNDHEAHTSPTAPLSLSHLSVTGNLCPKCGCNTMVREEGCRKCYSCGHSEC
jgi:ribonucleoside-diphosphate reductase alpha chain